MKSTWILILFFLVIDGVNAQHYGGFTFTPYAVENYSAFDLPPNSNYDVNGKKVTFGYSVGYQGLLMPNRRFSFSYGLLYTYGYNETTFNEPVYQGTATGQRVDMESLQAPLWWRYNFLKNKKWQPFIAVSTSINYALVSDRTFIYKDRPTETIVINNGFFLSLELAVGVNYTTDKWLFTVQPTFGGTYARQVGVGLSVLRKF